MYQETILSALQSLVTFNEEKQGSIKTECGCGHGNDMFKQRIKLKYFVELGSQEAQVFSLLTLPLSLSQEYIVLLGSKYVAHSHEYTGDNGEGDQEQGYGVIPRQFTIERKS